MRLLISNINRFATASQIADLFNPFGLVLSSKIVGNSGDGSSEGVALVEMGRSGGPDAIKKLNNFRFMNRFIQVEEYVF